MTEQQNHQQTAPRDEPLRVLIAGGGVAGLEAAFALRELAGDSVHVTLLAANDHYVYRPWSVGEPFTSSHAERFSLAKLAAQAGADLVSNALTEVDPERRRARTAGGAEITYDALLVGVGAHPHAVFEHATNVDDSRMDELLHGLVQDIEGGCVRRLAIVVPAPMPWPFPAYELALMASERAWDMQTDMDITLLTPERSPLEIFGAAASRQLSQLLADRRIEVVTSAYCEIPRNQLVIVHPGCRSITAERIVALPQLRGPALVGLPSDGGGFVPVDDHGRVKGVDRVWAAGDATDYPIKQGTVAAQLAVTAARSIAALAGVELEVPSFAPVLEGVLMTGGTKRYLRHQPASGRAPEESVFSEIPHGSDLAKIVTHYLEPQLREAQLPAVTLSP
jgi:sulfide:quinone oxidoreductase